MSDEHNNSILIETKKENTNQKKISDSLKTITITTQQFDIMTLKISFGKKQNLYDDNDNYKR